MSDHDEEALDALWEKIERHVAQTIDDAMYRVEQAKEDLTQAHRHETEVERACLKGDWGRLLRGVLSEREIDMAYSCEPADLERWYWDLREYGWTPREP